MTFTADLSRFVAKANGNVDLVVRKVTMDLARSVVLKTPVGNPSIWKDPESAPPGYVGGRARANWQFGVSMPSGVIDGEDSGGQKTISKMVSEIGGSKAGGITYIANNLPYIEELENGHSKQAPAGMLRLTVTEFNAYVRKATQGMA